mmetsp:Transcript_13353/g.31297  ORF Transcript_13353/g.31297 Transcript_13353/m.31297 type:complete len:264 (+) Transcript_13353:908-1699(+)
MKAMSTKAHRKEYRELKIDANISRNSRTKRVVRTILKVRAARNTRTLRRKDAFKNPSAEMNSKRMSATAVATIKQSKMFHLESRPVKNCLPSRAMRQIISMTKQNAKPQSAAKNQGGFLVSPLLVCSMLISIWTPRKIVLQKMRMVEILSSHDAPDDLYGPTRSRTCLLTDSRPCAACSAEMSLSPCCNVASMLVPLDSGFDFVYETGLMGSKELPPTPILALGDPGSSCLPFGIASPLTSPSPAPPEWKGGVDGSEPRPASW